MQWGKVRLPLFSNYSCIKITFIQKNGNNVCNQTRESIYERRKLNKLKWLVISFKVLVLWHCMTTSCCHWCLNYSTEMAALKHSKKKIVLFGMQLLIYRNIFIMKKRRLPLLFCLVAQYSPPNTIKSYCMKIFVSPCDQWLKLHSKILR